MRKRKRLLVGVVILIIVLCSACGNSAEKENVAVEKTDDNKTENNKEQNKEKENRYGEKTMDEIKEDLEKSDLIVKEFASDDGYHIKDVELIKRNTTESTDDVYCTITVNSDYDSITQSYQLTYNHYTTGGWILDAYLATSEQTYLPLVGVDEVNVEYDISEQFGSDCDYEILDHETDLNSLMDCIKIHIKKSEGLFKVSGTLTFNYVYADGIWGFLDYTEESDYKEYNDFVGTWVCDYAGDGRNIRLFLVKKQEGQSLVGDYIQLQILSDFNKVNVIEEFKKKPFTDKENGTVFWDSQGYDMFNYDKNTIMELDNTPFEKYSNSYMTLKKYLSDNYPGYEICR